MEVTAEHSGGREILSQRKIFGVIGASSVGTMIEWYDFYIFGSLATIIAAHFYPKGNDAAALLSTLATFGAGFAARPFGALVFGRIGDLIGRKYAFLVTLLVMGGATFLVGCLPDYGKIGFVAPLLLVLLRIIQGLALGGEYGGAAVYVAEHVPDNRRGFYTSFIQTTATLGLFISLIVVVIFSESMSKTTWESWGWRIPFLMSSILVIISLIIRLRLKESPLFAQLKEEGKTSKQPITDSFGTKQKWQTLLLMLWGATAGQAVVWYTGQFYAFSWLQKWDGKTQNLSLVQASWVIAIGLLLGTPFFIVFGALSDRIGRKPIIMAGCLAGALFTIPIFRVMYEFTPLKQNYQPVVLVLCVWVLVIFVTMVYGPIAAFLVEAFPSRVRYTSVSLPYHIGNGYFGGFLPYTATVIVTLWLGHKTHVGWAPYMGLLFPVTVALITFVVGSLFLRETRHNVLEQTEASQRGFSPVIFGILVALSAIALILADQALTPKLSAQYNLQWPARIFALLIAACIGGFALYRRSRREQGDVRLQAGD